jgi:hypothetical protein
VAVVSTATSELRPLSGRCPTGAPHPASLRTVAHETSTLDTTASRPTRTGCARATRAYLSGLFHAVMLAWPLRRRLDFNNEGVGLYEGGAMRHPPAVPSLPSPSGLHFYFFHAVVLNCCSVVNRNVRVLRGCFSKNRAQPRAAIPTQCAMRRSLPLRGIRNACVRCTAMLYTFRKKTGT